MLSISSCGTEQTRWSQKKTREDTAGIATSIINSGKIAARKFPHGRKNTSASLPVLISAFIFDLVSASPNISTVLSLDVSHRGRLCFGTLPRPARSFRGNYEQDWPGSYQVIFLPGIRGVILMYVSNFVFLFFTSCSGTSGFFPGKVVYLNFAHSKDAWRLGLLKGFF